LGEDSAVQKAAMIKLILRQEQEILEQAMVVANIQTSPEFQSLAKLIEQFFLSNQVCRGRSLVSQSAQICEGIKKLG